MAGTCTSPSWSDLPTDVLILILERLELPQSPAFASVCTTWRAAAITAGVPLCCTPLILSWAHLQKTLEQGECSAAVTCNLYHLLDGNKAYEVISTRLLHCVLWSLSWMACFGKRTLQSCALQPLHHAHYPSATNHGFLMRGGSLP